MADGISDPSTTPARASHARRGGRGPAAAEVAATDAVLRRTLIRVIVIRVIVGSLLFGVAIAMPIAPPGTLRLDPLFALIGLIYALTIVYVLAIRLAVRHRWVIDLQLAADALIVSALIGVTGGIASVFSSLYVLPIIAATTIRFRRGGLLIAALSTVLYAALVLVQYLAADAAPVFAWPNTPAFGLPTQSVAQYTVALNAFGFFAVALLSGSLAESLRSAGARLQQASLQIADLEAFNQHVIDSLPSGLATTDPTQCIVTFNHAAQAITGLSLDDVVGRPVTQVLQLPPQIAEVLDHSLDAQGIRRLDSKYRTADGRGEREIGLSATHIETPGGRAGFLITFQDVTEVKKLERDARRQQRLAAVGEMAAGIAHEIRNPLASMSGSIQVLRQELPLSSEQEQLMDIVLRESERLNATIGSFLAYARPQRFALERLDVRRAVTDTAHLLRNSAEISDRHTIHVSVPESELWYEADENQIKQVVWNLATNGVRAMPHGGRLSLTAARDAESSGIVITVEDEGTGIPPEVLDRLFQPFHGGFGQGSGLGLAIVHRIVTDYGGEIRVSSPPGAGACVSIHLPAGVEVAA